MRSFVTASTFSFLFATAALAAPARTFGSDGVGEGLIGDKPGFDADVRINHVENTPTSISKDAATSTIAPAAHATGGEEYVVIFDVDKPTPPGVEDVLAQLNLSSSHEDVKYTFENSAFRGFAASMKSHCLELLDQHPDVSTVEQAVQISSLNVRNQSPWGLQRISSTAALKGNAQDTAFNYNFDGVDSTQGKGVDIYVVDTGVNVEHQVFGGRAQVGFSFEQDTTDGDGHGTHVAGTAGGAYFGVASGANIWAVKVLGADGAGTSSATLAGMNWVVNHNEERKKEAGYVGAVMSMSWGLGAISTAVDTAIRTAIGNGIHVSVAAGNSAVDSCTQSPSASGGNKGPAITVGSIAITNAISSFSNSGACNDVYGPGENILSAWNTQDNMVNFLSGTSMACPHVSGVIAYLAVEHPELAQDPAAMKAYLAQHGLPNIATGNTQSGDAKILVNNDETGSGTKAKRMTVRIRDEVMGPVSTVKHWAAKMVSAIRRSEEVEFVLKHALLDGVQLRV